MNRRFHLGHDGGLPALRQRAQQSRNGSAIVNLASVAGSFGSLLDPLYSIAKGGVTVQRRWLGINAAVGLPGNLARSSLK
jgi:NAD(P)-dependent dehydrogenase (short-subunit alcohol dehydrogenase family)